MRTKIKITEVEKMQSILDSIQKGKSRRLLTVTNILSKVKSADEKLDKLGIAKKYRKGMCFEVCTNEHMPKSYKYPVSYTSAIIQYSGKGWVIENIGRYYSYSYKNSEEFLQIPESNLNYVQYKLLKHFDMKVVPN